MTRGPNASKASNTATPHAMSSTACILRTNIFRRILLAAAVDPAEEAEAPVHGVQRRDEAGPDGHGERGHLDAVDRPGEGAGQQQAQQVLARVEHGQRDHHGVQPHAEQVVPVTGPRLPLSLSLPLPLQLGKGAPVLGGGGSCSGVEGVLFVAQVGEGHGDSDEQQSRREDGGGGRPRQCRHLHAWISTTQNMASRGSTFTAVRRRLTAAMKPATPTNTSTGTPGRA